MTEQLWDTNVEIKAVLREKTVKLGEIAKWHVGSFLDLDMQTNDDISLLCGDIPLIRGYMGRKKNRIVIKIKEKAERNE